jgi:hypothetical protein
MFGWPITQTLRQILGLKPIYVIPLTGMQGWPNGKLAAEIRQYAPQLFEGTPKPDDA